MDLWALTDLCTPRCVHVAVMLGGAGHIEAGVSEIDGEWAARLGAA